MVSTTESFCPDGSERIIHEEPTIVYDQTSGQPMKMVGTTQDITERKQAEQAMAQALKAEQELGELKSRFVSMASHEFRTPLASVLASTELLLRYRSRMGEERIVEKLNTIAEQVKYLVTIIEEVLDLSRMGAGRADFKPVEMDLDGLCRNILEEFRSRPDVTQELLYACRQPALVVPLDKRLMRQIISNLVSNAIKYSPPRKQIVVNLEYTDESAVLRVRDQGIGIPPADLKRLFEPFHRADNVGILPVQDWD